VEVERQWEATAALTMVDRAGLSVQNTLGSNGFGDDHAGRSDHTVTVSETGQPGKQPTSLRLSC